VQAVIQDGEWTRLVEAGEILADNSRVLKVSAEGVEILRPGTGGTSEIALAGTELANATVGTIRLKLLKIGALVKLSVRRVRIAMASGCPYQDVFAHAYGAIMRLGASP